MYFQCLVQTVLGLLCVQFAIVSNSEDELDPIRHPEKKYPSVMVAVTVRNKAHVLPYFLHYLESLEYPKDRISLWIASDHNSDDSIDLLQLWLNNVENLYHNVDTIFDSSEHGYQDEMSSCDWPENRFSHILQLKQEALETARYAWADYLFLLDADVLLVNPDTLSELIKQDKTVIGPLLNTSVSDTYANFWGGIDENGYYKRSAEYMPLLNRHWQGCYQVANIHSAVLIQLRHKDSDVLTFYPPNPGYAGALDDVCMLGIWSQLTEVPLHLLNTQFFGFVPEPLTASDTLETEKEQLVHIKLHSIVFHGPLKSLPYMDVSPPPKTKLGFDQIYMINLKRRPDRRRNMQQAFDELGIQAEFVDAVDGQHLNESYLKGLGVEMLKNYADPYHHRAVTKGEIGCFLSHYFIWKDMEKNNYQKVIVFEDDLYFVPYFTRRFQELKHELATIKTHWELVYLGRKRLNPKAETWLTSMLVWPDYSYWTLSYVLTKSGADKLLGQKPLTKLVPVDEYLPIMFDRHDSEEWKAAFNPRNLRALSAEPLLVYPTHYTGEPGYITDTEDSEVIDLSNKNVRDIQGHFQANQPVPGSNEGKLRGDVGGSKQEL